MSDPPPPYKAEAVGDAHFSTSPSRLLVHLQVWHYTREGRSPRMNQELASRFQNSHIQAWEVVVPDLDGVTDGNCQDQYVPVEVQFRHRDVAYNDPREHPIADVRALFFNIAPRFIYEYFIEIRSAPHNMNIFPVDVPEEFKERYTHLRVLNRLYLRVNTFCVPGPMRGNLVQSWLEDSVNTTHVALDILSMIVTAYTSYIPISARASLQDSRFSGIETVPHLIRLCKQLLPTQSETRQEDQTAEAQVSVIEGIANPMLQYRRVANIMGSRFTKLGEKETLSNQDLYELVQTVHRAGLQLSDVTKAAHFLDVDVRPKYVAAAESYQRNKIKAITGGGIGGAGVAALAVFSWGNPLGLVLSASLGGGAAAGSVAGFGAHSLLDIERGKALDKKVNIDRFKSALKDFDEFFTQASNVIALVFISQVMRVRLHDEMPEHRKQEILESLGVDIGSIDNTVYNEEVVFNHFAQFRRKNERLTSTWDQVLKDADFDLGTTRQAA